MTQAVVVTSGMRITGNYHDDNGRTLLLQHDHKELGLEYSIPAYIYRPLLDPTDDIAELCNLSKTDHVMMSTDELKRRNGTSTRKEHRVAQNQLIKVLNKYYSTIYKLYGNTVWNVRPLDRINQVIHNPSILEELNNRCTAYLSSTAINE